MNTRFRAKKRFGQNFLIDENIKRKIIEQCELNHHDVILEIGSGRGEMTTLLCKKAAVIYALEIDPELCEILKQNLKEAGNVKIINENVLKFDFKTFFAKIKRKIKVVGNIPYGITSPIIERLLENKDAIDSVYITVQKEFAQRMVHMPGSKDYGAFSCFVQYYSIPKILFSISKNCFRPIPTVDSCLAHLKIREKPPVNIKNEKKLFAIIRAAFNKKRKTLRNSLKEIIALPALELFFEKYSLDRNTRPENLSLADFANLTDLLSCCLINKCYPKEGSLTQKAVTRND